MFVTINNILRMLLILGVGKEAAVESSEDAGEQWGRKRLVQ